MELLILGSGSSVPHPKRTSSAYWLGTGSGSILLDCSPSAIHRMAQEGCAWADLDAIWISHFHLDHCGGLAPFLFGTKHAPETQERTKPMRIFGPPDLTDLIAKFDAGYDYGLLDQPFPVEVIEIGPGTSLDILPGLKASVFSTPHTDESCAIRLDEAGGASLVFTSDTGYSTNLAVFCRNADVLISECSYVKDKPTDKHLDLADIFQMSRFAKPGQIVLSHFYPEWDAANFLAEVSKFEFACEVLEATDGMRLSVSARSN